MTALDRTCVVVPTRNEAANIERLVETLKTLAPGLKVLVVDDESPDGTADLAEKAGARVLRRSGPRGRGAAVLDGFALALEDEKTEFFVEMDADFSHEPKELPALVEEVASGHVDMCVASRYHNESRIIGWPFARHVFSGLANAMARALLRLPLSDCTNGYRAYTRRAVEAIEHAAVNTKGFFVLSETAYQLREKGMRFSERPSLFVNRERGSSNLSVKEIAGAFRGLLRLAFGK